MRTVKLESFAAVTCLQTQLTRTSLSENSCPHLLQYYLITSAQKVSDLSSFEVLKASFVARQCGDMRNIRTVAA